MPDPVLLAPPAPLETIPTYRLVDVLRCLDQQPAAVTEAFSGKVVLIGSNLPEEDRKRTPDRFMRSPRARPPESATAAASADSAPRIPKAARHPGYSSMPRRCKSVMTGNLVRPLPLARAGGGAGLASLGGSLLGFAVAP